MNYCPVCMILTSEKRNAPPVAKNGLCHRRTMIPYFSQQRKRSGPAWLKMCLGVRKSHISKKEAFRYGISAGIIGYANEYYSFYVPYAALARCYGDG